MASEWRLVEFGDLLLNGTRNGVYKGKDFHGSGVKIVNMGELFAHPRLRDVPMKRVELTESELEKSSLQAGDLLFARRSLVAEGAGKCSIVMEINEPTTFESSIIRARPDGTRANSLFLYYMFNSPQGRYLLGTILRQVAVSGITGTDLVRLKVPAPPLRKQQAIACILGALDDKIELNRRMNRTLEATAQAIFKSWFVDFDPVRAKAAGQQPPGLKSELADLFPDAFEDSERGEIPRGWRVRPLPEVMCINPTRLLSKGTLAPYLDMANMPTQGPSPEAWVVREMGSGMKFMNGDTLVARITPCLENGKMAFVDFLAEGKVGWGSTEYLVLRPKGAIPPLFAYLLARTDQFRTFAIQQMTGSSGRQRVPATSLDNYSILTPDIDSPLYQHFGSLVSPMFDRIKAAMMQSRTLAALRDTLLPKLISGELAVAEAERIAGRRA